MNDVSVLFEIGLADDHQLEVLVLNISLSPEQKSRLIAYVREWFDLDTNLAPFYQLAGKDNLLKEIVRQHYGYRIIGQPDLFESLVWAVLGQQINLQFAYTLKQRFVEQFGEKFIHDGIPYFLFPTPERVAVLTEVELLPLQFSRQKCKYIVLIAKAFVSGEVSKDKLKGLTLSEARDRLMTIKGVGNWTANYALMKTYRYPDAFPIEDAGLRNALQRLLKLDRKPTREETVAIFSNYAGWEAYVTLYLWKTL